MKKLALIFSLALISACNGPWNMQPEEGPLPEILWISSLVVANRPLDTIWIEQPVAVGDAYDSLQPFINVAASKVYVIETALAETVSYLPSPGDPRAWLAQDTVRRVKKGAEYRLFAAIRWNGKSDTLRATTWVPRQYALDSLEVPVEMLHPSLSVGLPRNMTSQALSDGVFRKTLYDSLDALSPLLAKGVTEGDFLNYLNKLTVVRPASRGDSLYYIYDVAPVTDLTGDTVLRYSQSLLFFQDFDPADYGGIILSEHFDSTRAWIFDPLSKLFSNFSPEGLDTASRYQPGNVRPVLVLPNYATNFIGYPDTLRFTNLFLGYTGPNTLYSFAVDSLYFEYYKGMAQTGINQQGGLGGGNSRAQNVLKYSNIENGYGYFAGAVVDSFPLYMLAAGDTIPISELRAAYIERKARGGED